MSGAAPGDHDGRALDAAADVRRWRTTVPGAVVVGAVVARALVMGVLVVGALTLAVAVGGPGAVAAAGGPDEAPDPATSAPVLPEGAGRIIVPPDSGRAPDGPGDRGGWQQLALFGLILSSVGVLGALAWRDARTSRRQADGAE